MTVEIQSTSLNGKPPESNGEKKLSPRELFGKMSNDADYDGILESPDLVSIPVSERKARVAEMLAHRMKEARDGMQTLIGMGFNRTADNIEEIDKPYYSILHSELERLRGEYHRLIVSRDQNTSSET
jgi:hypothetical protein